MRSRCTLLVSLPMTDKYICIFNFIHVWLLYFSLKVPRGGVEKYKVCPACLIVQLATTILKRSTFAFALARK